MRPAVHKERAYVAWLSAGTLAAFAGGLAWSEILAMTGGARKAWWRIALADAEDRGLVEWDRPAKVWRLTVKGREHTRGVE